MKNRPDLNHELQQYTGMRQNEQMTINLFQCLITNCPSSVSQFIQQELTKTLSNSRENYGVNNGGLCYLLRLINPVDFEQMIANQTMAIKEAIELQKSKFFESDVNINLQLAKP